MATAASAYWIDDSEPLRKRAAAFALVVAAHSVLIAWVLNGRQEQFDELAPVRMDVRMVQTSTAGGREIPREVPRPQLPSPAVRAPEPVAPEVLMAARSAEPPSVDFVVPESPRVMPRPPEPLSPVAMPSSQPLPVEPAPVAEPPPTRPVEPMPEPRPVEITPARFDAAYLHNPPPVYTEQSRRRGEQGKVLLLVQVTAEGVAAAVDIKQSSGFTRLDQAAVNAVRKWRFVPARRGAETVAATVVVPVTFRLDN